MALFNGATYMNDESEFESIETYVDVAKTILDVARYSGDYTGSVDPSKMFARILLIMMIMFSMLN